MNHAQFITESDSVGRFFAFTVLSSSESELRSEEEDGTRTRFPAVWEPVAAASSSSEEELDLVGEGVRDFWKRSEMILHIFMPESVMIYL